LFLKGQNIKKFHYTYRITNTKYFSSSTNKLFIQDQKDNPNDYIYKIVYINEEDRKNATNFEIKYHKRLNVATHPMFLNKANAHYTGCIFNNTGKKHSDKSKLNMKDAWTDERRYIKSQQMKNRLVTEEYKLKVKNTLKSKYKSGELKSRDMNGSNNANANVYKVIDPDNNEYIITGELSKFSKDQGLSENALPHIARNLGIGKRGKAKNWIVLEL